MITKLIVRLDSGRDIELTGDEARELYDQLRGMYAPKVHYVPDTHGEWMPPHEISDVPTSTQMRSTAEAYMQLRAKYNRQP